MAKKLVALALVLCMLISMTACTQSVAPAEGISAGNETAATTETTEVPAATEAVSTDGVTIKAFMYEWPSTDDAAVAAEINKRLGFTVDWVGCPGDEGWAAQERLIAADPTVDIFYLSPAMFAKFQAYGMLLDVSAYQSQTAEYPNLAKFTFPKMDLCRTKDGKVYGLPFESNGAGTSFWDIAYRNDWLEAVGMSKPTTIDEFNALLAALKEKYPDKYPLLDQIGGNFGYASGDLLARAFSEGGNDWYLNAEGKLQHPIMNPGYKDYVAKMAEWYQKGYLNPQFIEMKDSGPVTQMMTAGDAGVVFAWISNPLNPNFSFRDNGESQRFEFALGSLQGPKGGGIRKNQEVTLYVGINANTKNPVACMKALDFFSSEEGTILVNHGIEGRNYDMVNGILTKSDKPEFDYQAQWNPYGNVAVSRTIRSGNEYMDIMYESYAAIFYNPEHQKSMYSAPDANFVYDWTGKQYKTLESQVNTFINELITNTITGKRSIDDWDTGVQEALGIGLQTMVDERNELYSQYLS